ncbi:MAG TPA: TonB-dependent receptor plug domain-containing protein [Thermodesulfobacteriota bacterium]|nr:TonB-dependent receptor plug domain-containing protein [Thermodesulfobacteriota bacterium]
MILISSLTEKRKKERAWTCVMRRVFLMCFLICVFPIFNVSTGVAEEEEKREVTKQETKEEKKEEKTVLEEITVTGTPIGSPVTPINSPYGTQSNLVTEEQIKLQNSYDVENTLRNVPGVMFQTKNLIGEQTSHSLYIRGRGSSHPSPDLAIQFDGVPRFGALFGQVLGDGIAVSTIGGIEIYKSPQPAQFGSGYALVNFLPKYLTKEGQEVVLNFSGGSYYTFNQSLSGGVKKGPFDAYVSQSWVDTDGYRPHSRAEQQNYYANFGYQLNKEWNIRFLTNYVNSKTEAPMPNKIPTATNGVTFPGAEQYNTETYFTTLTLNNEYEHASGFLKAYWNDTDFKLLQELNNGQRYGNGTGGLHSTQEISLYGIRGKEKLHLWPGGEILVGTDLDLTDMKNTQRTYTGAAVPGINGGLADRVWDFPETTLFSPYVGVNQTFSRSEVGFIPEGFHIIPSGAFRYYVHDQFKDEPSYQAGLVAGYKQTDLHLNYSRGVNYPSPIALMNFVLVSSPVANPSRYWQNIKPEVVDHYEVGLTHAWPKIASLGATVFYDKGKDRFQDFLFGPIPVLWNDPIGKYDIRGLELSGTVTPVQNLEIFGAATWLQANAIGNNGFEVDHLPYTPGAQFQAGGSYKFLNHFQFYMDMQYLRDMYQGTNNRPGTLNFTQLGRKDKLDDIILANARLSYRFDYWPFRLRDSEIFVAVNNIFNQHYEYLKGYPVAGTTVFGGFTIRLM